MIRLCACIVRFSFFAVFSLLFADLWAQDGLEPMAGAGGVMRDAERRALKSVPTSQADSLPTVVTTDPATNRYTGVDAKKIGIIAGIRILGSVKFANNEEIVQKLLKILDDGTEKTVGEVNSAFSAVRQELLNKGYYLARISLARKNTYDKKEKVLSVVVDEGRFGELTVRFEDGADGTWYSREQILKRFKNINAGDTFDYGRLRSALFDANSHPDITIDTEISVRKPIEGEGEDRRIARYADMMLDVRERFPLHLVWEINNYGMEEVEEWQTSLTAQYLNLTKHDDVLTISPSMSLGAELMSIASSYMLPHSWWRGGNTTLYGGWSSLDVDNIVPRLDLEGTGYFVGLQHSENIFDNERHLIALSSGILYRYIEDQYTALGLALNERGASILPVSLAMSYTGRKADFLGGRNFATVQALLNVMSTGDSLDEMWTDAEENYWLFRWQMARLQPLFGWYNEASDRDLHQWILFLKLEGQYTSDTLIPVEKLSLGGYNCMRGYRTRGYLGDYGVYGTAELRTPILVDAFSSCFGDRTDKTPIDRLQFLGFLDYGYTAYNNLPSGYDDDEFLFSCGLGARLSITKHSQIRCDFAVPLTNGNSDDDDFEIYLALQLQY